MSSVGSKIRRVLFQWFKTHVLFILCYCILNVFSVNAAVIPVDGSSVDNSNSTGNCSLVEAIRSAETDTSIDNCVKGNGDDTIVLSGSTFELQNAVDGRFGNNGLPCISSNITLLGAQSTIRRATSQPLRLFCILEGGSLTMSNLTLTEGLADGPGLTFRRGGGVLVRGSLYASSVEFLSNSAVVQGGAIFVDGGNAVINNSTFIGNVASRGGAIRSDSGSTSEVVNSRFQGNTAGNAGGAVFVNDSSMTISESFFSGNFAGDKGGGVYFSNSIVSLLKSQVVSNTTVVNGGGVRIDNDSVVLIDESYIHQNVAQNYGGGGIYLINSVLTLKNSTIANNQGGRGGGLNVDVSTALIENVTFSGNVSAVRGAAVYLDAFGNLPNISATATIRNSTLFDNAATSGGGGVWGNAKSRAIISNSIIADNTLRDCAGPGEFQIRGNNWFGDQFCSGVASGPSLLEPLASNGGFSPTHLINNNPGLIDTGDNSLCPARDQLGGRRPKGLACDIGSLESTSSFSGAAAVNSMPAIYLLLDE